MEAVASFFTGVVLDYRMKKKQKRSGLKSKYLMVRAPDSDFTKNDQEFRWHYLDSDARNKQRLPIMIMIHGYSSTSEAYLRLGRQASDQFRVIVPDLTGHGKTTPLDSTASYDIPVQAERLAAFVNTLLPDTPFHVLGHSMGGWLASLLAIRFSGQSVSAHQLFENASAESQVSRVTSVSLLCPAGINPSDATDEERQQFLEMKAKLLPTTPDELRDMLKFACVKSLRVPQRALEVMIKRRKRYLPILKTLLKQMDDVEKQQAVLTPERLGDLKPPSLIMWGTEDVFLTSEIGVKFFEKHIENTETQILPACGHMMLIDKFAQVSECVLEFSHLKQSEMLESLKQLPSGSSDVKQTEMLESLKKLPSGSSDVKNKAHPDKERES